MRIASCVSASTPGVTRTSTRRTPAAAARSGSSSASSTTSATGSGGGAQLLVGLVVAVHEQPVAVDARAPREGELAERRDVGAEALLGQQPHHRDVRERLRAVDDERLGRRPPEERRPRPQRLLAVDDERRAEPLRELGRGEAAQRRARRRRCARSRGRARAREQLGDGDELVAVVAEAPDDRRQRCERRIPRYGRILSVAVVQADDRARMSLGEHAPGDLLRARVRLPVEAEHAPEDDGPEAERSRLARRPARVATVGRPHELRSLAERALELVGARRQLSRQRLRLADEQGVQMVEAVDADLVTALPHPPERGLPPADEAADCEEGRPGFGCVEQVENSVGRGRGAVVEGQRDAPASRRAGRDDGGGRGCHLLDCAQCQQWSFFPSAGSERGPRRGSFPRPLAREAFLYPETVMETYDPKAIEAKWQRVWEDAQAFLVPNPRARASGDDGARPTSSRCSRTRPASSTWGTSSTTRSATSSRTSAAARGSQVLRPMGYDAFGLPAENAAIKEGGHPRELTERNIATIREQMQRMGWAIDWSREVSTARSRLLPLDAVALPALLRARPGLPQGGAGQLVPEATRPCSRTSR